MYDTIGDEIDLRVVRAGHSTEMAEEALAMAGRSFGCLWLATRGTGSTFRSIGARWFRGSLGSDSTYRRFVV